MKEIKDNLANLTQYAVNYFKELLKKYGKEKERKTKISEEGFEQIEAKRVTISNAKLYVNREEGFAGYGLKKDEFVCDCSDIDDIIAFNREGKFSVAKIDEKKYFGKEILHIAVFDKNDDQTVYNMIYRDGLKGTIMVKRFSVAGVTRDKMYELTKGNENSKILFFSVSQANNAPTVEVILKPRPKLRNTVIAVNFNDMIIKNRSAMGNVLTKFPVQKIVDTKKIIPSTLQSENNPETTLQLSKTAPEKEKTSQKKTEVGNKKNELAIARNKEFVNGDNNKKEKLQMKLEL
jgi:topoisomerase-4 subunit A